MGRFLLLFLIILGVQAVQAQLSKISLKDINGKTVQTDTLSNGGKPFIIDFFATWCKPCNRELDAIHEVYADWQKETGVKIIAVSIDQAQNINKVKPLVDNHGWEYEVLLDPNGDLKRAISDMWNNGSTKTHYYQGLVTFNIKSHRIQAGYGRTRAGYNCSGGVCRYVPATKGFTLSYNYNF